MDNAHLFFLVVGQDALHDDEGNLVARQVRLEPTAPPIGRDAAAGCCAPLRAQSLSIVLPETMARGLELGSVLRLDLRVATPEEQARSLDQFTESRKVAARYLLAT